ncbi:MAG TPA: N-acetylneuraminate synthase family protein [Vicinamibacterales bacterium]|jgi:N-acetylneuraminate synthase
MRTLTIGNRVIGDGQPTYIVAEIGINHNGSLDLARRLIDAAADAKCDAVKFQKRTPELCVPAQQRDQPRETPWGVMSYLDYRRRIEFGVDDYERLIEHCRGRSIDWLTSCWDESSVDFIEFFEPVAYKIPSAALTDVALLRRFRQTGRPLILSTGMSTMHQIEAAVALLGTDNLMITHATSSYPCPLDELNLRMIETIRCRFDCAVGYSGHEVGLATTLAAVCLGATLVERHITLDRAMWGTDQAASVEPQGLVRLVNNIRDIETALGDGVKTVYESERAVMKKLRRTDRFMVTSSPHGVN